MTTTKILTNFEAQLDQRIPRTVTAARQQQQAVNGQILLRGEHQRTSYIRGSHQNQNEYDSWNSLLGTHLEHLAYIPQEFVHRRQALGAKTYEHCTGQPLPPLIHLPTIEPRLCDRLQEVQENIFQRTGLTTDHRQYARKVGKQVGAANFDTSIYQQAIPAVDATAANMVMDEVDRRRISGIIDHLTEAVQHLDDDDYMDAQLADRRQYQQRVPPQQEQRQQQANNDNTHNDLLSSLADQQMSVGDDGGDDGDFDGGSRIIDPDLSSGYNNSSQNDDFKSFLQTNNNNGGGDDPADEYGAEVEPSYAEQKNPNYNFNRRRIEMPPPRSILKNANGGGTSNQFRSGQQEAFVTAEQNQGPAPSFLNTLGAGLFNQGRNLMNRMQEGLPRTFNNILGTFNLIDESSNEYDDEYEPSRRYTFQGRSSSSNNPRKSLQEQAADEYGSTDLKSTGFNRQLSSFNTVLYEQTTPLPGVGEQQFNAAHVLKQGRQVYSGGTNYNRNGGHGGMNNGGDAEMVDESNMQWQQQRQQQQQPQNPASTYTLKSKIFDNTGSGGDGDVIQGQLFQSMISEPRRQQTPRDDRRNKSFATMMTNRSNIYQTAHGSIQDSYFQSAIGDTTSKATGGGGGSRHQQEQQRQQQQQQQQNQANAATGDGVVTAKTNQRIEENKQQSIYANQDPTFAAPTIPTPNVLQKVFKEAVASRAEQKQSTQRTDSSLEYERQMDSWNKRDRYLPNRNKPVRESQQQQQQQQPRAINKQLFDDAYLDPQSRAELESGDRQRNEYARRRLQARDIIMMQGTHSNINDFLNYEQKRDEHFHKMEEKRGANIPYRRAPPPKETSKHRSRKNSLAEEAKTFRQQQQQPPPASSRQRQPQVVLQEEEKKQQQQRRRLSQQHDDNISGMSNSELFSSGQENSVRGNTTQFVPDQKKRSSKKNKKSKK